jgi:hypothetical protein
MRRVGVAVWMRAAGAAAALIALAGCGVYRDATTPRLRTDASWREVATDTDRSRLRNWRKAWDDALPVARAANAAAIAADPALFDPDTAQAAALPPQGDYRCRTVKLGSITPAVKGYTAYPWFACRIADEGSVKSLRKLDGSQRPIGLIYPETDARAIFLGTLVLGDETDPFRYGLDRDRDMIGYVERVAPARWRLVLPYPRFESQLDVIELTPAG